MFNQNQLQQLYSKLNRITRSEINVVNNFPTNIQSGNTFSFAQYRGVKALTAISKGSRVLIFRDSNSGLLHGIAEETSQVSGGVISENKFLSRHTQPIRLPQGNQVCELTKVAYAYKIFNEVDKTQEIWISDFENNQIKLLDVSSATEFYQDETYTYDVTFPSYNYELYEISYSFGRDLGTSVYEPGNGSIEATGSLGVEGGWTVTVEREYGPNRTTPPSISIGSLAITENITAQVIIPPYFYGEPSTPIGADPRPPTSIFEDDIGDGDDFFDWSEIWNSGSVSAVVGDGDPPGLSLIPWILEPNDTPPNDPVFLGTNPDGNWNLVDTNNDGNVDRISGFVSGIYRYVTQWNGSLSVTTPSGQSKTPDSTEFSQVEVYLSNSTGKLTVLIRESGRPVGRGPGVAGQSGDENDPWFGNIYRFEIENGVATPVSKGALPLWLQPLNDGFLIQNTAFPETNEYERVILSIFNGISFDDETGVDYLVETQRQVVDSGVATVWGWKMSLDIFDLENFVLTGSGTENYDYFLTPIHVIEENGDWFVVEDGGNGNEDPDLPTSSNTPDKLVKATLDPIPNQESYDPAAFEILDYTSSWSENSIYVCHDTSKVITPGVGGS